MRVTSLPVWWCHLNFNPIRCATMLCQFGQLRSGSVATHFVHFSRTVTSSTTGEYVTVPERIGQKDEPNCRNEERTRNKPSSALKMYVNEAQYDRMYNWACKYEFLLQLLFNLMIFCKYFSYYGKFWSFMYSSIYCVAARISTLMSISDGWGMYNVHFPPNDRQSAAYEGRNGWIGVYFPP